MSAAGLMCEAKIARGGLYLSHALCERWLAGIDNIVLVRRDDDLLIFPVHQAAAGGSLLKQRNAAGDRVVHAPDFFQAQGIDGNRELALDVAWDAGLAAIRAQKAFLV